jgi:hypothetical protein
MSARDVSLAFATQLLRLQWQLTATDLQRKLARLVETLKGYNPDQPRVPAGNPDGGQWTSEGGDGGQLTDISSSNKPGGHHFVPRAVYRNLPLRSDTRKVFDQKTTAPLRGGPHGWSRDHAIYNRAVAQEFDKFLKESGILPQEMTPDQARTFLQRILDSHDPRIRGYNLRLYMREFQYWLRRMPRVTE